MLSDDTFLLYAMHNYDAPACSNLDEFNEEVKRFGYITRAFKTKSFNTQLILNHIIILFNVFNDAATEMLLFKVDRELYGSLLPFLIYLNRIENRNLDILLKDVILNDIIITDLREL